MVISPFPKTGCVRPPPSTANCSAGRGLCNNNHDFKNKSQISYLKQAGYLDRSTLDIWSDPWQYCRIGCLSLMIDQKARPNEHFFLPDDSMRAFQVLVQEVSLLQLKIWIGKCTWLNSAIGDSS